MRRLVLARAGGCTFGFRGLGCSTGSRAQEATADFHHEAIRLLKSRVIPCLDVKDGRVVKGVNFVDLRDAGDPVAMRDRL